METFASINAKVLLNNFNMVLGIWQLYQFELCTALVYVDDIVLTAPKATAMHQCLK